MSTTIQQQVTQRHGTVEEILQDYRLSLTGQGETSDSSPPAQWADSPDNWPTQYRRIPPYRPINRNLDLTERPNGSSRGELVFVTVMLNGVRLQSGLVRAWEFTGGRWYPGLTRYRIGGEW
ncbi:unnamed protein product [Clonostachys solani]|uniref:Uncharacterized protein n=1 Tax=Clonostachys solani TaxID=160281 RepID=A0A9N9ZFH9_9HYPO|nr:unnamed protein product [Clonostachys solani]